MNIAVKYARAVAAKPSEYDFLTTEKKQVLSLYDNAGYSTPLLFWGPPGTGKTAMAKMLPISIYSASGYPGEPDVVFENASANRNIDLIRRTITTYAQSYKLTPWDRGFVVLDEADGLTDQAQDALKGVIDRWQGDNQFILTTNHPDRLSQALRDRCNTVQFPQPTAEQLLPFAKRILTAELSGRVLPDQKLSGVLAAGGRSLSYRRFFALMERLIAEGRKVPA